MKLPQSPPPLPTLVRELDTLDADSRNDLYLHPSPLDARARYLAWDEIRHREPPTGHSRRTWWLGMFTARRAAARELSLYGKGGQPFWYAEVRPVIEAVRQLERAQGEHVLADETLITRGARHRRLNLSLMDESIQSSQLEGANTSRMIAREMLRDGRPPRDHGERMIANNFAAMQTIEDWAGSAEPIDLEHLLELHRIVTRGTLSSDADSGRLQQPGEARVFVVSASGAVVHRPPPAEELPERMQRLCDFASGATDAVHPIVRAILMHFMIGYDHPFVDGNGRTARALFYWSLLRSGFWLAPYLSISEFLLRAPARYSRVYQHVTADSNDATYFILHQLDAMLRAVDRLAWDLREQAVEARRFEDQLGGLADLNERQTVIVGEALRDPNRIFTIAQQRRQHGVSYWAARSDLQNLADRGLLIRRRSGKKFVFRPAPDLPDRLGGAAR